MTKNRAIPRDNSTRWNSFARMIHIALETQVRHGINRWFEERPGDQPEDERITDRDWATLEKVQLLTLQNSM